jgi:chorismate dehydratase
VKVSAVGFLNAAPLYWGLKACLHPPDWEVSFDLPSRCAERVLKGEADLGLIPSIEFARSRGLVLAAPLCVGARREVTSVLLLCGGEVSGIRTVYLHAASRTSQMLTRILLADLVAQEPLYREVAEPPTALAPEEAALVIGDPALTLPRALKGLHRYDLAELWNRKTGLPFVFAVWAGRKSACTRETETVLARSHAYGMEHLEEIVDQFSRTLDLPPETLRRYLTDHLSYPFGGAEVAGLRRFVALALKEEIPDERLGCASPNGGDGGSR